VALGGADDPALAQQLFVVRGPHCVGMHGPTALSSGVRRRPQRLCEPGRTLQGAAPRRCPRTRAASPCHPQAVCNYSAWQQAKAQINGAVQSKSRKLFSQELNSLKDMWSIISQGDPEGFKVPPHHTTTIAGRASTESWPSGFLRRPPSAALDTRTHQGSEGSSCKTRTLLLRVSCSRNL